MSYLKKNGDILLTCLVELLIGVLLFIDPVRFTTGILLCVGVILALWGALSIFRYFRTNALQAAAEQNLAKGLLLALLGAFLAFRTNNILTIFPILTQLYGAIILIIGILKFQQCIDYLRLRVRYWFLEGINAAIAIIFAMIVLKNPFGSTIVLWKIAAAALILAAILDIVVMIFTGKTEKSREGAQK